MTDQNDPDLDAKTLRFYSRHKRRRRWQRWREHGGALVGPVVGLIIASLISYAGLLFYWDHVRLAQLLEQIPPPASAAAAPAAIPAVITVPPSAPAPTVVVHMAPVHLSALANPKWAPGSWEALAAAYINAHAYDGVSSATPPRRRHSGPRAAMPGTLSPPPGG
jgi:hypothetical protein